jgi:PPE-repeat protein
MLGRGYEYMDLDQGLDFGPGALPDDQHAPPTAASGRGAGTLGFAGTARNDGGDDAAGLTTLAGDSFGGGPRMPMTPGTWDPSQQPPDPGEGGEDS